MTVIAQDDLITAWAAVGRIKIFLHSCSFMFYSFCVLKCVLLRGNALVHKTNFERGKFPIDGPVVQNRTHGWEPTSEKMTPCEGIIREDTIMYLMLEGGKLLNCRYKNN